MSALSNAHLRTNSRSRFALGLIIGAFAAAMPIAIDAASAQQQMRQAAQPQSSALAEAAAVEVSRVPYQAFILGDCLNGSNFCRFESDVVSNRRRLELHRISCQGWHGSNTPPNFVTIVNLETAAGTFVRRSEFLETSYTRVNTNSVWAISEQVLMFIPAGHRIEIALNSASTGVGSYGCAISGYLVTLGRSS